MHCFTITYTITFIIDFAPYYAFNKYRELYNLKTGRRLKKISNNGTLGYKIKGKFYSLKKLRKHLIKPEKESLPF